MIYKRFQINCLVRILLLVMNLYLFFFLLFKTHLWVTTIIIGGLPILQVYLLTKYVNQTNTLLSKAFESIRYDSFSEQINTRVTDASFIELCDQLNRILLKFHTTRMEKEQQFQYLKAIINQAGMGLISIRHGKDISLINKAARQMLETPPISHTKQLKALNPKFYDLLMNMKSGEKNYFEHKDTTGVYQLAVYASDIDSEGKNYQLFTLQNIQKELEEKEMDAWKKLIRVLSHEIMNSITPISSLASTAKLILSKNEKMDDSTARDLSQAVSTIEKRSQGLMQFVQNYRSFAQIPDPSYQILPVADLLNRIHNLSQIQITENNIDFIVSIEPENLQVNADPDLLEQVLINLMANAVEAVKDTETKAIEIRAYTNRESRVQIDVVDNGCGIEQSVLPKVFIPFFSTKPEGSGIGLSLSRQIMRLHGGLIRIDSKPRIKTITTLIF